MQAGGVNSDSKECNHLIKPDESQRQNKQRLYKQYRGPNRAPYSFKLNSANVFPCSGKP